MFVRQCQCPPAVISYDEGASSRSHHVFEKPYLWQQKLWVVWRSKAPSCRCPYKPPWANYTLLLKFLLYGFVLYFQAASSLRLHCSVALNALLYILECAGTTVGFDEEKLTLTSTIDPTCGHLLFALFKTTTNTIPYSIYMDSTWPNYIRFGTELTWGRVVLQGPTWPTGTTWFGDEVTVTWTQAPKFAIF